MRERCGERAICRAPEGECINRTVSREVVQEDAPVCGGLDLTDKRGAPAERGEVEAKVRSAPLRFRDELGDEDLFNPVVCRIGGEQAERGAAIKACVVFKARARLLEHATRVRRLHQGHAAVALLTQVHHRRLAVCRGARHDAAEKRLRLLDGHAPRCLPVEATRTVHVRIG